MGSLTLFAISEDAKFGINNEFLRFLLIIQRALMRCAKGF